VNRRQTKKELKKALKKAKTPTVPEAWNVVAQYLEDTGASVCAFVNKPGSLNTVVLHTSDNIIRLVSEVKKGAK